MTDDCGTEAERQWVALRLAAFSAYLRSAWEEQQGRPEPGGDWLALGETWQVGTSGDEDGRSVNVARELADANARAAVR